ncbi:hemagglutinin repeat-containing protein, partial [Litchfieldella qijiaojingensis]|uniref:hemagglutinin repeat-containing protein n=1 Tax=Litchfieldella qijiaojingensis TaxID=980347 RepID=UPI00167845E0
NRGLISTQGDLAVTAHHLTQRGGRLASGGTSTYRLGGTLDNLGRLTGVGNVDITTSYLNNRGTLGSQADLRIVSRGGIDNRPDTLLFAGGDMTLRGTRLVNRYGDIYSRGNLDFARNDRQAKAERLENRSGTIEAEGDISLYAGTIVNTKEEYQDELVLQERSLSATAYAVTGSHQEYYSDGRDSDKGWIWVSDGVVRSFSEYELQEKYETEVAQDSPAAQLVAGGDMAIRAGDLENANSLIAANGNLHIQANTLKNQGAQRQSVFKRTTYGDPQALAGLTPIEEECRFYPCFDYTAGSRYSGYWVRETLLPDDLAASLDEWNANDGRDAQGQDLPLPEALSGSEQLSQVVTRTPLAGGDKAVIQAGGRVSINVANRLDNGQVDNGVRERLNGSLANTATSGVVDTLDFTLARRTSDADTRSARQHDGVARSDASATDNLASPEFSASMVEAGQATVDPTPPASTDLDISMVEAGQATVDPSPLASADLNVDMVETGQSTVAPGQMALAPGDVASYRDVPFERVSPTQLSSFRLPRGRYGLFVRNTAPQSRYLIETNPEFTSADQLMGSDYLLDKLDYTADGAYQLLGDGRYESRLIRDAVLANTGQRFLEDSLNDDYAQYRHLMDNAVAAKNALQLSVGVGLTPAQTAALTHDIVWLEEQQVDGETVLAPVLYLAQVDERNVRGSSLIQGSDIDLIAGGDLVNVGTIRASHDLAATSGGSILQGGLLEAGQRLDLSARDSIRNALAGEIRGGQVSLMATEGDIVNDRTAITAGHARSYATYLDQGGLISARDSLDLSAGRDIVNRAEIESQGDVAFLAGRDIVSEAVANARRQVNGYESGVGEGSDRTTQLSASLTTGGDAALIAGRDVTVTASDIIAEEALAVTAARDIRLEAGEDTTHDWGTDTPSHRWYGRKRTDERTTTQVGSQLSSGDDTRLSAGRDVRLTASEIDSGAGLAIAAGNDIVLDAAENETHTQTDEWRRESQTRTVEQAGSALTAREDIALQAQRHITAIASRAEAAGNLALDAGGDLTFASAANIRHHEAHTATTDWISRRVRQQGSELLAGKNLTMRSGRDLRLI